MAKCVSGLWDDIGSGLSGAVELSLRLLSLVVCVRD